MARYYLFPRLSAAAAQSRLGEIAGKTPPQLSALAATSHRDATFSPTGGSRVPEQTLAELRRSLVDAAQQLGFPDSVRKGAMGSFDAKAARLLVENLPIMPGEASRDDVWAFLALVLLPDIATWRFSEQQSSRVLGGVRNAFQRLWWRARVLQDAESPEPYALVELPEDALVGLMERPALSSNPRVALAIAKAVAKLASTLPPSHREDAWRDFYKRVRQRLVFINFEVLAEIAEGELERQIEELRAATARILGAG
jgi:hypothetical protein